MLLPSLLLQLSAKLKREKLFQANKRKWQLSELTARICLMHVNVV